MGTTNVPYSRDLTSDEAVKTEGPGGHDASTFLNPINHSPDSRAQVSRLSPCMSLDFDGSTIKELGVVVEISLLVDDLLDGVPTVEKF